MGFNFRSAQSIMLSLLYTPEMSVMFLDIRKHSVVYRGLSLGIPNSGNWNNLRFLLLPPMHVFLSAYAIYDIFIGIEHCAIH